MERSIDVLGLARVLLMLAAVVMVIGAPAVARLAGRSRAVLVRVGRLVVAGSLASTLAACSPAERCAAARGATIAARAVELVAARACSGELVGAAESSGGELEALSDEEREDARRMLDAAAAELEAE